MGVEASNEQVLNLFKIQDEFGIPISLTLNTLETHMEVLHDKEVREGLIAYIKKFYDYGLRLCTQSNKHLMASGILQEHFPDMEWKNTVNHMIRSSQEVADYAALGYTTILLDRSLNRDFKELKNIKRVADLKGVKTSLLASEGCLPSCPFKDEHDDVQYESQNTISYWAMYGNLSCNRWRFGGEPMPRSGTDLNVVTKEQLDELLSYVDILKFSGRLAGHPAPADTVDCYHWNVKPSSGIPTPEAMSKTTLAMMDSFSSIYDAGFEPLNVWAPNAIIRNAETGGINSMSKDMFDAKVKDSMFYRWQTPKGLSLSKVLLNCRNQCWDCHACERVFDQPDMDTLLEMKPVVTSEYMNKVDVMSPEFKKRVILLKEII
jgi:collagenase-like PrtC family protease